MSADSWHSREGTCDRQDGEKMSRRMKWTAFVIGGWLTLSVTGSLLWPWLAVFSLGRQLRATHEPGAAAALVDRLLEYDSAYACAIVAQYASESHLRAFDRHHRIFLEHDPSTGTTHEVIASSAPAALPRQRTSQHIVLGDPSIVFSRLHCVGRENDSDHVVTFVCKDKNSPHYRALVFQFHQSRLISEGVRDVTQPDLARWQQAEDWPQDWHD